MPNPNVVVEVAGVTITGPEEGLTLSGEVHVWGTNYPTDGICEALTVTLALTTILGLMLPTLWRSNFILAIKAAFPAYTISQVIFPGLVVISA